MYGGYIRWMCIYFILFYFILFALRHVLMFELVLGGYQCLGDYYKLHQAFTSIRSSIRVDNHGY
jgi:hypothetical protein